MKTLIFLTAMLFSGCGVYTFNGSTLPSHLKTVEISLFESSVSKDGVAEELTTKLSEAIRKEQLLSIVPSKGNSSIHGRVIAYTNGPYSYTTKAVRDVDISSYSVKITVEVKFFDNVKEKPLFSGLITEEGIYDFKTETEEDGIKIAVDKIVAKIIENTTRGW